jgi:hypothetical protein
MGCRFLKSLKLVIITDLATLLSKWNQVGCTHKPGAT